MAVTVRYTVSKFALGELGILGEITRDHPGTHFDLFPFVHVSLRPSGSAVVGRTH